MHIRNNIENFLKDKDYYIDIFDNSIHVYNYVSLEVLKDTLIELKLNDFSLVIDGSNLIVRAMDKREILIRGVINNVRFIR